MGVLSRVVFDPDTTPPTVPGSVVATALSQSAIRVTWTASTDTGGSGLAAYRVLRSATSGGVYAQIGTDLSVASLSYDDANLSASSTLFYRVIAVDGNGNVSAQSASTSATTQAANPSSGLTFPAHAPSYLSLVPEVGGYGMQTVAGSGRHLPTPATTVILVNSLAAGNTGGAVSGLGANVFAGTFEYAWRHSASPKAIIPIVSGWVQVQDSIPCQTGTPPRPGYVSYYGQAAPNPGLFLRGANVASNGASDMAVWHLRSYMGDDVAGLSAGSRDCFSSGYGAGTTSRVVLINCEFAWSVDELCDFNRSHSEVTMVNCAFVEPLHVSTVVHPEDGPGVDHGFGPIVGGDTGQTQTEAVSSFRCLYAHTTGRNPLISARTFVHANNLHYNHGRPTGGAGNAVQIIGAGATAANAANIVGNAFVRGPNNNSTFVAISVTGTFPAGSAGYSSANAQFGWTAPANQAAFFTASPSGYVASSLQSAAYPGSWGAGLGGVLQWAANPLAPTTTEWNSFIDLMSSTVGAQPRYRTTSIGRVGTVINQIRNTIAGVAQSDQFVDTVTEAGGWFGVTSVTIDPLNPGTHWHAPLPTGSDRDTPYTSGTFSNGKSRVGYTRLEEWAYEQHLYVTVVDLISPTVPANVQASALSQTTIRITWNASTDSGGAGLAGYRVLRSTTSSGTYTQVGADVPASSLSFDDASLSSGQQRFYRVVAFDGRGNVSLASATVNATTNAAASGDLEGPYSGLIAGLQTGRVYSLPISSALPNWGTSGGSQVEFVTGDWYDGSNSVKLYPPTAEEDSGLGSFPLGLSSSNPITALNLLIEVKFGSAFCATALTATPKWTIVHCTNNLANPPAGTSNSRRPMLYFTEFVESDTTSIHLPQTYAFSAGQGTVDVWGPSEYNYPLSYPTVHTYPGQRQPIYFGQNAGTDGGGNPIMPHSETFTMEFRIVTVSSHPGFPDGYIGWRLYRRNGQSFTRGTAFILDGHSVNTEWIYEIQQFAGGYYNIGRAHNANHYIHVGGRIRIATNYVGWVGPRAGFLT